MSVIDEIKQMQSEGRTEEEIGGELRARGFPENEISDGFSQLNIKNAVLPQGGGGQQYADENYSPMPQGQRYSQSAEQEDFGQPVSGGEEYSGMEPSISSQMVQEQPATAQNYYGDYGQGYEQYQPYQESVSSDVITEISEQVVNEKLSQMREHLEKTLDFKNNAEAKIDNLSERLKRIEGILDKLQISILQKVGEYVGDVKDIKKEMRETQKSFKAMHKGKK